MHKSFLSYETLVTKIVICTGVSQKDPSKARTLNTVIQVLMEETDLKAGDSGILHFNLWAVIGEKAVFKEVYYEPCLKL